MTKKAKVNQLTIEENEVTTRLTHDPQFICGFIQGEINPAFLEKWELELREFPKKNPKARFIRDFYEKKGWKKSTYYMMIARFPSLKEAHEEVIEEMGDRMWSLTVDRKASFDAVHHRLHRYGQEARDDDTYHAKLKQVDELYNKLEGYAIQHLYQNPTPEGLAWKAQQDKPKELKEQKKPSE
jgi:hypothetical protein